MELKLQKNQKEQEKHYIVGITEYFIKKEVNIVTIYQYYSSHNNIIDL